jgi:hypothetical protein
MTFSTTVLDFGKYRTSGMSASFSQTLWCLIWQEEYTMERFFSLYKVICKGIISPFLLLILIPQALKIGVDAVVRIPVLFVAKDEIYIKALPGVGGPL